MYPKKYFLILTVLCFYKSAAAQDPVLLKRIRGCLGHDGSVVCLKETALDALNETIMSETPMRLFGVLDIIKDPDFLPNRTEEFLPRDFTQRSLRLNELLFDKVEEFFESRSLKVNLGSMFEGRGKKDKKGGMLMMGGLAMAGMMAQMFMGKIAFMAGAALLVAKLALLLSTIIGFKKLSGGGGGGGESQHIVYASAPEGNNNQNQGSWHRSIAGEESTNHHNNNNNNPYRAYSPNEIVDNYTPL